MAYLGEECPAQERWLLQSEKWLSTGILAAVPSVLFPHPPTPDSPQASQVHFALCLPESRASGCKWNYVCWLCKRLSVSPAFSLWQTGTLLLFTTGVIWFLSWLLWVGEPGLEFRSHSLKGNNLATEIFLQNFSCHTWEPSHPSHASFAFPTSLVVVKFFLLSVCGYKASFQLVFSWLFNMIFL